jgi:hypothetical protein
MISPIDTARESLPLCAGIAVMTLVDSHAAGRISSKVVSKCNV